MRNLIRYSIIIIAVAVFCFSTNQYVATARTYTVKGLQVVYTETTGLIKKL